MDLAPLHNSIFSIPNTPIYKSMTSKETIVVIGAGVLGLTTALRLQETLTPSQSLLLIARDFPDSDSINYASAWAGAHYRPVPDTLAPSGAKEAHWAKTTYETFKKIANHDPASGVRFVKGVEILETPSREYLDVIEDESRKGTPYAHVDGFRVLGEEEVPGGRGVGFEYLTYCVNSPVYCAFLLRRFVVRGGRVRRYTLSHLNEAFCLAGGGLDGDEGGNVTWVANCSGMGFSDPKSYIIRGQTCLVRNPCNTTITRQNANGSWSFCIPRPLDGGTIIGGTKEIEDWNPSALRSRRDSILREAAEWFPFEEDSRKTVRGFDVIRDIVGRRPARRGGVRLEVERVDLSGGKGKKGKILHVYGVGGRGFELSWGIAGDAVRLFLGCEDGLEGIRASL